MQYDVHHTSEVRPVNKVLTQTYSLLSMTLLFSAVMAFVSMKTGFRVGPLIMILVYFGLLFAVEKTKNSVFGLFWVFALTGWLGLSLGPLLNYVVGTSGYETVVMALAGTGGAFLLASGYGRNPNRDLSRLGPFLLIGMLVAFVCSLINVFFLQMTALVTALSAVFIVVSTGVIAWYTNSIVRGGETNYITATVVLYVALYNIFVSLLSLLGNRN